MSNIFENLTEEDLEGRRIRDEHFNRIGEMIMVNISEEDLNYIIKSIIIEDNILSILIENYPETITEIRLIGRKNGHSMWFKDVDKDEMLRNHIYYENTWKDNDEEK